MDTIVGQGQQLARTFIAAVESRDPVRWAAMFADDAIYTTPDFPEPLRGRGALETLAATLFKAIPDMEFEVRSVVEQGNMVAVEGATRGTFAGPMMTANGEVPPTGKSYVAPFVAVCELSGDGLIAVCREYYDTASFAAQLGLTG